MRYRVKGQERDSHAVLPVEELAILQLLAPSAEASPQPLPQKSNPARRSYYQPHFSYNQPRDDNRNLPQQHRRDLNLSALHEHLSNEDFVAEHERNTSSQVSTDSQEPFDKKRQNSAERECHHQSQRSSRVLQTKVSKLPNFT